MRVIRGVWGLIALALVGFAPGTPAVAVAAPPAQTSSAPSGGSASSDGWQFEVVPYLWAVGLDGDTKIGLLPATGVEASFSDLVDILDFALMTTFQARRDRGGFLVDAMYFDLGETAPTPNPIFGDAEVDLVQQIYSAAGTWRVSEGRAPVTLFGGVRYVDLDNDLELTSGVAAGRSVGANESWWDGFVGAGVRWQFAEDWALVGYGDIGGGGSEMTWQGLAGVDWTFSKHLSAKFGYRYLNIDYDEDDFVYDMAMAGGYAALGIRF